MIRAVFFIYVFITPSVEPPSYETSQLFSTYAECEAYQSNYPAESAMSACFPVVANVEELS